MSLPIIGWREVLKALKKRGFYVTRQTGSHICVTNGTGANATIPRRKELKRGLLLGIIGDCNMTKKEFLDLL